MKSTAELCYLNYYQKLHLVELDGHLGLFVSCVVLMNKTLACCVVNSLDCYLVAFCCNSLVACFDSSVKLLQNGLESGLVCAVLCAEILGLSSLFIADLMLGIVAPPYNLVTKILTGFSGEYRRFSPAIRLS